eukprot:m.162997 g.162997  ORF g.162997 m.162997 type:complete len:50 (-) comp18091_c0_seq6:136-285(-)
MPPTRYSASSGYTTSWRRNDLNSILPMLCLEIRTCSVGRVQQAMPCEET